MAFFKDEWPFWVDEMIFGDAGLALGRRRN
jgi:hypothetical protein